VDFLELWVGELVLAALVDFELVVDVAFGQKPQNPLRARLL